MGLGGWGGSESLPSLKKLDDTIELVTWFDANSETVDRYRGEVEAPAAGSWEEVLDNPRVEGVILVVPNHVHPSLTIEAAGRGKHVWIEKPMANTVEECNAMIQACEDAGIILQIGHSLRRAPAIRMAKKMVEDGKIGEPVMVEGHQSHRGGWGLTPEHWRWYQSKCPGGPLNLLGIHQVDAMHYLVGPSTEVTAMMARKCLACEIDEVSQVIIRFKNDMLGYIGDTYISPVKTCLSIYGSTGFIEVDCRARTLKLFDVDSKCVELTAGPLDLIADEFKEFAECIVTGREPETGGAEGRAAVAVLEAAVGSARTGRTVKIQKG